MRRHSMALARASANEVTPIVPSPNSETRPELGFVYLNMNLREPVSGLTYK
jgi:hypothetical protein